MFKLWIKFEAGNPKTFPADGMVLETERGNGEKQNLKFMEGKFWDCELGLIQPIDDVVLYRPVQV